MVLPPLTDRLSIALGTACYAAGLLYGCWSLLHRRRHSRIASYSAMLAGWALQTLGLYLRARTTHSCPLGNKFEVIQFVAWSASFLYLFVGPAFRMSVLGFFSAGLATFLGILSLAVPQWDGVLRVRFFGVNPWVEFHAALALFSYGVLGLLALTSFMYLLQSRNLRHKQVSGLFRFLPPLVSLDQMNLRLLAVGVALLSVSVGIGGIRNAIAPGGIHATKLVVTLAVWAIATSVLALRWRQRLVARPFALAGVALFAVAVASLWPINASRRPLPPPPAAAPAGIAP